MIPLALSCLLESCLVGLEDGADILCQSKVEDSP